MYWQGHMFFGISSWNDAHDKTWSHGLRTSLKSAVWRLRLSRRVNLNNRQSSGIGEAEASDIVASDLQQSSRSMSVFLLQRHVYVNLDCV
jgi:hypothetical protein